MGDKLIGFDTSTNLGKHAHAERARSLAAQRGESEGFMRGVTEGRNFFYQLYTKTPHPSTLGRGGSR